MLLLYELEIRDHITHTVHLCKVEKGTPSRQTNFQRVSTISQPNPGHRSWPKEHKQNFSLHLCCRWVSLCRTLPRRLDVVAHGLILVLWLQVSNNRTKQLFHTRILGLFGNSYSILFIISHLRFLQLFLLTNVFKSLPLPVGSVWNMLPFIHIFLQVHTKPNTAILQVGFTKVEWSEVLILFVLQQCMLLLNQPMIAESWNRLARETPSFKQQVF